MAEAAKAAVKAAGLRVLKAVRGHRDKRGDVISEVFEQLPTRRELPVYYKVIKQPIDLRSIEKAIKAGDFSTVEDVGRSFELCWTNAMGFNQPHSPIWLYAKSLKVKCHRLVAGEQVRVAKELEQAEQARKQAAARAEKAAAKRTLKMKLPVAPRQERIKMVLPNSKDGAGAAEETASPANGNGNAKKRRRVDGPADNTEAGPASGRYSPEYERNWQTTSLTNSTAHLSALAKAMDMCATNQTDTPDAMLDQFLIGVPTLLSLLTVAHPRLRTLKYTHATPLEGLYMPGLHQHGMSVFKDIAMESRDAGWHPGLQPARLASVQGRVKGAFPAVYECTTAYSEPVAGALAIKVGQRMTLVRELGPEWFEVRLWGGVQGVVPSACLGEARGWPRNPITRLVAAADMAATAPAHLSLRKGEGLTLVRTTEEGLLVARSPAPANGTAAEQGLVPPAAVEERAVRMVAVAAVAKAGPDHHAVERSQEFTLFQRLPGGLVDVAARNGTRGLVPAHALHVVG